MWVTPYGDLNFFLGAIGSKTRDLGAILPPPVAFRAASCYRRSISFLVRTVGQMRALGNLSAHVICHVVRWPWACDAQLLVNTICLRTPSPQLALALMGLPPLVEGGHTSRDLAATRAPVSAHYFISTRGRSLYTLRYRPSKSWGGVTP